MWSVIPSTRMDGFYSLLKTFYEVFIEYTLQPNFDCAGGVQVPPLCNMECKFYQCCFF